ncbi:hypothetical protein HYH02_002098 [Chlamydomonas schloesseri]|uniref:BACK domain-containing protein n=1 Tax=Chlamydomonas schloesseri TaxID=2026947 RepID=A0A836BBV6_9CHLO|nr:hypothetical protein HYH02_002098 [Chlamydomonas schloesseri]|eukprot:KAG2453892.1 hypothetical protein HYH02_002098 [Chlamydomonas schloesseri]
MESQGDGSGCRELPAHSFVLAHASEFFKVKLSTDVGRGGDGAIPSSPFQRRLPPAAGLPPPHPQPGSATHHTSSAADAGAKHSVQQQQQQQQPVIVVPVESPEEEAAARAVVAFCYSGRVSLPPPAGVRAALQVLRQAAFLQVEGCEAAALEELSGLLHGCEHRRRPKAAKAGVGSGGRAAAAAAAAAVAAGLGAAAAESSGGKVAAAGQAAGEEAEQEKPLLPPPLEFFACRDLWPSADTCSGEVHDRFHVLAAVAAQRLVEHFGDALQAGVRVAARGRGAEMWIAVFNNDELFEQFLALPAANVAAVLSCSRFGADCENTVLHLLARWMGDNYHTVDAAEREKLCRCVRLVQLTPTYMHAFLPALAADHQTATAAVTPAATAAGGGAAGPGGRAGAGGRAAAGAEGSYSQHDATAAAAVGEPMQVDCLEPAGPSPCKREHAPEPARAHGANASAPSNAPGTGLGTNAAAGAAGEHSAPSNSGSSNGAGTGTGTGTVPGTSSAPPLGWFPITPAEAVFIANLAGARSEGERQALLAAGARRFGAASLDSDWYCAAARQQCLDTTITTAAAAEEEDEGRAYDWSISREDLQEELAGKARGEAFLVESGDEVAARGFVWVPYVKGKVGEPVAALFLRAALPAAFEAPGSALSERAAPAVIALDAELSVQRLEGREEEPLVVLRGPAARVRARRDVTLRFCAYRDFWMLGKGRGHDALPLRMAPGAAAGGGGGGGGGGGAEEEGVLEPWGEYLAEGAIKGTLRILPPSDLV